jgi:hypothetical protein
VADVDIRFLDPEITLPACKKIMKAGFNFVGTLVYHKPASDLKPDEVTVLPYRATRTLPALSAYGVEIIVRLCTVDQPKTRKGKVSKKGHDKLAKDLVRLLYPSIPEGMRFYVWINSGTITGFADGVGGVQPE